MRTGLLLLTVLAVISSPPTAALAETVTWEWVSVPYGGSYVAWDFVPDGSSAAVNNAGEIFRWESGTGLTSLGVQSYNHVGLGISEDGSTIVASGPNADGFVVPQVYTDPGGWSVLGPLELGCPLDASVGSAWDISDDGSTVVGMFWTCNGKAEAFSWNAATGFTGLGRPAGGELSSRASQVSGDGSVIVGWFQHPTRGHRQPVRWVNGGEAELFHGLETNGEATGVSSDGSKICGSEAYRSFYYTDAGGVVTFRFPSIDPNDFTRANAIADDGTIVGWFGNHFIRNFNSFIWRPDSGIQQLKTWANANGAEIPDDFVFTSAIDISEDGKYIAATAWDLSGTFGEGQNVVILRIDDQKVSVTDPMDDSKPSPRRTGLKFEARPNPFNPTTTIYLELDHTERVRVSIHDTAGRKIIDLAARTFEAGTHSIPWNGQDAHGRTLASGVYFATVETPEQVRTTKLTLLK